MTDISLKKLGRIVGVHLGDGPDSDRIALQRREFLSAIEVPASGARIWIPVLATAAALLILGLGLFRWLADDAIPFRVNHEPYGIDEGRWIAENPDSPTVIEFASRSRFVLARGASARVVSATSRLVMLDLTTGTVNCSIVGNGKTRWVVRAGTYEVTVTGTEFSVRWDPAGASLDVIVTRGSVLVFGAALGEHGVKLARGNQLRVDRNHAVLGDASDGVTEKRTGNTGAVAGASKPSAPSSPLSAQRAVAREKSAVATKRSAEVVAVTPLWKDRLSRRDYAGAMDAASQEGLDHLSDTLGFEDLWSLGKAARYARRGSDAASIFTRVRTRFPGHPQSNEALFLLGRVAVELQHKPALAQQYFEAYLRAVPSGALAEESLGKLIDVCQKSGRQDLSKSYAAEYLRRYPRGAFAGLARSVL